VTEVRICDQCTKRLITHRKGARFCNDNCKSAWHNDQRRAADGTDKRLEPADGGVGSRGGNVRSVSEARDLQSASKELDRWRLVMEQQVFHTLLGTGYFHVDDLDCLDLPPAAFEVRGTLVNRVRAKGWMERSGAERKVAHKAANARKAPIYRITAKGRHELLTLVGKEGEGPSVDVPGSDPGHSLLPGEKAQPVCRDPRGPAGECGDLEDAGCASSDQTLAGDGADQQREPGVRGPGNPTASVVSGEEDISDPDPTGQVEATSSSSPCADVDQGSSEGVVASSPSEEPARLFDAPAPSAYDPWSEAA